MKKGLTNVSMVSVATAIVLSMTGCGSNGNSASSSSISGSVQASILQGVSVCIKGTNECAVTDNTGKYTISGYAPPQVLEVKIGNSVVGEVNATSSSLDITPKVLADNNTTLAANIGAMLHKIGGCTIAAANCDLSAINSVDINASSTKSLVKELADEIGGSGTITLHVDGNDENITSSDVTEYEVEHPEMVSAKVAFSGAASVGDFATFSYDKDANTLSYDINGSVFGAQSGDQNLTNLFENVFFKDASGNFYFFSGALGVAQIPMSDGNVSYVVGLQMPHDQIDTSLIVNKRFNYIDFPSTGNPEFSILDINATSSTDTNGTWTDVLNDVNGTWMLDGTHIDVLETNGTKFANVTIRPASDINGKAGIIVDNISGGFGMGIEAKPATISDVTGTYSYFSQGLDATSPWSCYGTNIVTDNNDGNNSTATYTYTDSQCSIPGDASNGSATFILNPTVDINSSLSITLNGIAQISSTEYVFIDNTSGYYVSMDMNASDPSISVGSNKPLK